VRDKAVPVEEMKSLPVNFNLAERARCLGMMRSGISNRNDRAAVDSNWLPPRQRGTMPIVT
jgi:hypothetical protein